MAKTVIEPFKIKTVEAINTTTREEREKIIKEAYYNPFLIPAEKVLIDFLTDSGTSAIDFITNVEDQTITAELSAPLADGEVLMGSVDGGNTWVDLTAFVTDSSLSWTGADPLPRLVR